VLLRSSRYRRWASPDSERLAQSIGEFAAISLESTKRVQLKNIGIHAASAIVEKGAGPKELPASPQVPISHSRGHIFLNALRK
jgi:hypothetical protein